MQSFEDYVARLGAPPTPSMPIPPNWKADVTRALQALAAERKGKRPSVAELSEFRRQWESLPPGGYVLIPDGQDVRAYMNALPPEPRSVSHWGMVA